MVINMLELTKDRLGVSVDFSVISDNFYLPILL
jgi:hypothetical protein